MTPRPISDIEDAITKATQENKRWQGEIANLAYRCNEIPRLIPQEEVLITGN